MSEVEILNPCPICGKDIEVVCIGGGWFWRHKDDPSDSTCSISHSQKYSSREEAIKEINKRSSDTLIAQLQAENERLIVECGNQSTLWRKYFENIFESAKETIKTEAYKECIEKAKEEIKQALENNYKVKAERIEKHNVGEIDEFISYCTGKIDCLRGLDDFLDNLLKELVGDK